VIDRPAPVRPALRAILDEEEAVAESEIAPEETSSDEAAPAKKKELPKTGRHDRLLLLGAGAALALGGLSVAAGARRRAALR